MKKTNKGFTLVELIIVIAVIGVLAAILIPVFSNVIEKANKKSAFSDAKNALSIYLAEKTTGNGGVVVNPNTVFVVDKGAAGTFYFTYIDNGLKEGDGATNEDASFVIDVTSMSEITPSITNFPTNVKMYE